MKKSYFKGGVLLIDIGGTNIRSATAVIGSNKIRNVKKQKLDSLDSFDTILQNFLDKYSNINHLVFSIAGPKLIDSISMTNRKFTIDKNDILKKFSLDSCHILNDWESIGHSFFLLENNEMKIINLGNSFNDSALILGPGTGLGAAQIVGTETVLPTEIGNSLFRMPKFLNEFGILNDSSFSIVEDLISGRGLSRIYSHFDTSKKSPEEIITTYSQNQYSKKSIDTFLLAFSQILSELALIYMPGKGIFIMGSLMRSLHQFIDVSIFMNNFFKNRKPVHRSILAQMPIALVTKEMTCLHGSLNFINNLNKNLN